MSRTFAILVLGLVLLLGGAPVTRADDVPEGVRSLYEKALALEAKGDLKKAYKLLSRAKGKDPVSIDFWELYVRVWRGLDKKEDVLWRKIIGKAEANHPKSAVYELLRARLAEDDETRLTHLRAAAEKDPGAVGPQLLLARALLADGDEVAAEDLLDALLEKDPGNEEVIVAQGDLMLEAERTLSALAHADEQLEAHDLPGLHDLRARALLQAASSDAGRLDAAEASARKAIAGRADPRYVRTLVEVLDRKGDLDAAIQLIEEHVAKTPTPVLAAKLGEFAFRKGEYEKAIRGLSIAVQPSVPVLKALAACHGRLGHLDAMRKVCARLKKRLAEDDRLCVAWREYAAGEGAAALKEAEGIDGAEADFLRLWSHAGLGDVDATKRLAAERARQGRRWDEAYLLALLHAQLRARLGPKAKAADALLRNAEIEAAKAGVPGAVVDESEAPAKANSTGFMQRLVSYRRSLGGDWFTPSEDVTLGPWQDPEGKTFLVVGFEGRADSSLESSRTFWFNPVPIEGGEIDAGVIQKLLNEMMGGEGDQAWKRAAEAFTEGSAAMVDGALPKAAEAFGKALEVEPTWGRARLFRAAALALGTEDLAGAATEAAAAAALLVDDCDGRRLAILIRILAGQDPKAEAKAVAEHDESFATRQMDQL